MRFRNVHSLSFVSGAAVGLALAGSGAMITAALRRRREERERDTPRVRVIDGAKPIDPVALDARPTEDVNTEGVPRLESEAVDVPPVSQRW